MELDMGGGKIDQRCVGSSSMTLKHTQGHYDKSYRQQHLWSDRAGHQR